MAVFHDEVEIEDMEFDPDERLYRYPCPCGDLFFITEEELFDGEEIARCPSCSLIIRVIYNPDKFKRPVAGSSSGSAGGAPVTVQG